jgi:hypothetical protein
MHVEALRVIALGPRNDMRGPQQSEINNAGDRAPPSPGVHQRGAKNVLANPLDDAPLGLGRLR